MAWNFAGKVVVEPGDLRAVLQRLLECATVCIQRNVQYHDDVTCPSLDALEQPDVALDSADQNRITRRCQAKLQQCAQAVSITIEDIIKFHGLCFPRAGPKWFCRSHTMPPRKQW